MIPLAHQLKRFQLKRDTINNRKAMTDYSCLYNSLQAHITALEIKFIRLHLPVGVATLPSSYDLDVRAFCVLSHAAFEQFVEDVCFGLAQDAWGAWVNNQCCSQPLLALMTFQSDKLEIDGDEKNAETTFSAYIREGSDKSKNAFTNFLRLKNNGVSVKYLRKMLLPVGLNVPDEARWLGSLNKLTCERGNLAHTFHVKKITSPADARIWVQDCMEMFAKIRDDARTALSRPQFVEDYRNYTI